MNLPKNSKDLSGQRFDRLVAIKPISTKRGVRKNGKPYSLGVVWECECDCGNPAEVLATHLIAENMKNTNARPKGNRMHKGVSETRHGTWQADITCDGQRMYIGTYKTFEEACAARERQELELFGEFSRLHCITQNEEG